MKLTFGDKAIGINVEYYKKHSKTSADFVNNVTKDTSNVAIQLGITADKFKDAVGLLAKGLYPDVRNTTPSIEVKKEV